MDSAPNPPPDLIQLRYTVISDLSRGESIDQITTYLVTDGWRPEDARTFVEVIHTEQETNRIQAEHAAVFASHCRLALRHMKIGALWAGGGLIITLLSYFAYSAAGRNGYVVTWGAIIYGTLRFFAGYNTYCKLQSANKKQVALEAQKTTS